MTPCRGSMRPPSLGRPPSIVSAKRMPPSVTDIRRCSVNEKQIFRTLRRTRNARVTPENNEKKKKNNTYAFVRRQYAELYAFDGPERSLGVAGRHYGEYKVFASPDINPWIGT